MNLADRALDRCAERVRWQCRRGMLELDLVLDSFIERHFGALDEAELRAFDALLARPDPELFDLIMGHADVDEPVERRIIKLLRTE